MRKILFSLLLACCLTAAVPAAAAGAEYKTLPDTGDGIVAIQEGGSLAPEGPDETGRAALDDLLSDWEANGYPDDIGGVFYDQETGRMTILLARPGGAEREKALKALIPGIEVLPCAYSYNELLRVQNEITKEMSAQPAGKVTIYSAGIGYTTIDGKVTGFGESGKEFRVVVTVDESVYQETADRLYALYGDKVYVETGKAPVPMIDGLVKPAPATSSAPRPFALFAAALLAALAAVFAFARRHVRVLQTANGNTVTTGGRPTRKQVEKAVRDAAVSPGDAVFDRIKRDI
jgi:hypothetical protein